MNSTNFSLPVNNGTAPFAGFICPSSELASYCLAILWTRRITSVVSTVSSSLMLSMIILFKKYRVFNQRLILYLAVTSIIQTITYLLDSYDIAILNNGWCIFMGMMTQYIDWVAVLWISCITVTVCIGAVFHKSANKLEIPYHMICWGFPLVLALLPLIEHTYGLAGLWCWIRSNVNGMPFPVGTAFQFSFYYVPIAIIAITIVTMSMTVVVIVYRRTKNYQGTYNPSQVEEIKIVQKQIRSLYLYPWAFAFLYSIPFINRFRIAVGGVDEITPVGLSFLLWLLHANTVPMLGTVYTVIFALDKETRSRLTWSNIKNAILCKNTSRVAKPYSIDISVGNCEKAVPMTVAAKNAPQEDESEGKTDAVVLTENSHDDAIANGKAADVVIGNGNATTNDD